MPSLRILLFTIIYFLSFAQTTFAQDENCMDITIQSARILERKSRCLRLEIVLENKGTRVIKLSKEKMLGVQWYWSGDSKYNAGDIFVDGMVVKNFGEYGSILPPDGVYALTCEVKLSKKSRFLNNLIFVADALFNYDECNENNNIYSLTVGM